MESKIYNVSGNSTSFPKQLIMIRGFARFKYFIKSFSCFGNEVLFPETTEKNILFFKIIGVNARIGGSVSTKIINIIYTSAYAAPSAAVYQIVGARNITDVVAHARQEKWWL